MSRKSKRKSPQWQWEQQLIDDYYDFACHIVLDPLYEKFQRWKAGELHHDDISEAIHEVHKQNQKLWSFFTNRREVLVFLIEADEEWFLPWMADHPPPPGVEVREPSDTPVP
jgi:hypothetical protein